jgi:hypothetical protein
MNIGRGPSFRWLSKAPLAIHFLSSAYGEGVASLCRDEILQITDLVTCMYIDNYLFYVGLTSIIHHR